MSKTKTKRKTYVRTTRTPLLCMSYIWCEHKHTATRERERREKESRHKREESKSSSKRHITRQRGKKQKLLPKRPHKSAQKQLQDSQVKSSEVRTKRRGGTHENYCSKRYRYLPSGSKYYCYSQTNEEETKKRGTQAALCRGNRHKCTR